MKVGIRMVLSVLLICAALTMAVFTALGFAPGRGGEPESIGTGELRYVLGESGGNIAVYSSADLRKKRKHMDSRPLSQESLEKFSI